MKYFRSILESITRKHEGKVNPCWFDIVGMVNQLSSNPKVAVQIPLYSTQIGLLSQCPWWSWNYSLHFLMFYPFFSFLFWLIFLVTCYSAEQLHFSSYRLGWEEVFSVKSKRDCCRLVVPKYKKDSVWQENKPKAWWYSSLCLDSKEHINVHWYWSFRNFWIWYQNRTKSFVTVMFWIFLRKRQCICLASRIEPHLFRTT